MTNLAPALPRRRFLGLVAALAGALGVSTLTGCSALGGDGRPKVGFSLYTYVVPRWVLLDLPGFGKAAAEEGFETISQQADSKVDKQLNDVLNLLSQDARAMVIASVTGDAGVNLVRQCREDGIPVLAYNNLIPSPDLAGFVARDSREVGRQQALHAQEFLGGLQGNVIIAAGTPGDPVAQAVTNGVLEILQPGIDSGAVTVVSQIYHRGWDAEGARKQTEDALTRTGNKLAAVFPNNDGLAGGAINALRAQGLLGKTFVGGMDATSDACRAIVLGSQQMTMFTEIDVMAATAGHLAGKLGRGESIEAPDHYGLPGGGTVPWFKTPSYAVTFDNVVDYVKKYSGNGYVNPHQIFGGIAPDRLPPGAAELIRR
jgi:D-xylose transport system substrate-binding protein